MTVDLHQTFHRLTIGILLAVALGNSKTFYSKGTVSQDLNMNLNRQKRFLDRKVRKSGVSVVNGYADTRFFL